jgi:hypothetical protein
MFIIPASLTDVMRGMVKSVAHNKLTPAFIGTQTTSSPVKLGSMGMMSSLAKLKTAIQL